MRDEVMRKSIFRGKLNHEGGVGIVDTEQAQRFGALIRRRRQELGLSTHDLGRLIGTRNSTIMRIEQGAFAAPRPDKLAHIAEALRLSLADVYAHAGYVVPNELPNFHAYLPAKYRYLPQEAILQLSTLFDALVTKHGTGAVTTEQLEVGDGSAVAPVDLLTTSEGVT